MRNFDKWYYESINRNVINQIIWHIMSFTKLETPISNRTLYWQVWHLNRSWGCFISWNHFKLYFKYLFNKKEMRIWLENLIVRLEEDCKCIWNDVFCLSDNRFVMKRSLIDRSEKKVLWHNIFMWNVFQSVICNPYGI